MKRTRFKQRPPAKNRAAHVADREQYAIENPLCEWPGCRRHVSEVDHIIPMSGDSYEHWFNYFSTCRPDHDMKGSNNKLYIPQQIAIKVAKGEWFPDAASEFEFFGRCYFHDAREV